MVPDKISPVKKKRQQNTKKKGESGKKRNEPLGNLKETKDHTFSFSRFWPPAGIICGKWRVFSKKS